MKWQEFCQYTAIEHSVKICHESTCASDHHKDIKRACKEICFEKTSDLEIGWKPTGGASNITFLR